MKRQVDFYFSKLKKKSELPKTGPPHLDKVAISWFTPICVCSFRLKWAKGAPHMLQSSIILHLFVNPVIRLHEYSQILNKSAHNRILYCSVSFVRRIRNCIEKKKIKTYVSACNGLKHFQTISRLSKVIAVSRDNVLDQSVMQRK